MACVEFLSAIWIFVLGIYSFSTYLYMFLVLIIEVNTDLQSWASALHILWYVGVILTNIVVPVFLYRILRCVCCCKRGKDDEKTTPLCKAVSFFCWLFFLASDVYLYVSADDLEVIYQEKETLKRLCVVQGALLGVILLLLVCNCCSSKGKDGEKEPLLAQEDEEDNPGKGPGNV
jgi:hypothetical protein